MLLITIPEGHDSVDVVSKNGIVWVRCGRFSNDLSQTIIVDSVRRFLDGIGITKEDCIKAFEEKP